MNPSRSSATQKKTFAVPVFRKFAGRNPPGPVRQPVAEAGRVDRRDSLGAAGQVEAGVEQVVSVPGDLRHDLAEAERDDREVVAPETQGREADQHADQRREHAREEEQRPDRDVDAGQVRIDPDCPEVERSRGELERREPGGAVRAHRVERDVAEVEQPRVADDHVQADGHHHEHEHVHARLDRRRRPEDRDREQVADVERVGDRQADHDQGDDLLADRHLLLPQGGRFAPAAAEPRRRDQRDQRPDPCDDPVPRARGREADDQAEGEAREDRDRDDDSELEVRERLPLGDDDHRDHQENDVGRGVERQDRAARLPEEVLEGVDEQREQEGEHPGEPDLRCAPLPRPPGVEALSREAEDPHEAPPVPAEVTAVRPQAGDAFAEPHVMPPPGCARRAGPPAGRRGSGSERRRSANWSSRFPGCAIPGRC